MAVEYTNLLNNDVIMAVGRNGHALDMQKAMFKRITMKLLDVPSLNRILFRQFMADAHSIMMQQPFADNTIMCACITDSGEADMFDADGTLRQVDMVQNMSGTTIRAWQDLCGHASTTDNSKPKAGLVLADGAYAAYFQNFLAKTQDPRFDTVLKAIASRRNIPA